MSEPKFTPGPWWVESETGSGPSCEKVERFRVVQGDPYSEFFLDADLAANPEADAHLIASAPELYEAVREAQEEVCRMFCVDRIHDYHTSRCRQLTALLAKARGEKNGL